MRAWVQRALVFGLIAAGTTSPGCSDPDASRTTVEVPKGYREKSSKNLEAPFGEGGAAPTGPRKGAGRR